jgi:serine/threonine protein kinase
VLPYQKTNYGASIDFLIFHSIVVRVEEKFYFPKLQSHHGKSASGEGQADGNFYYFIRPNKPQRIEKSANADYHQHRRPQPRGQKSAGRQFPIEEARGRSQPGDRIGRYKLLQQIGEGGCGVVYMAEQEEPVRRRVALKVIKLGMDTKSVIARFEAERQALALMDHPNIAKVLDAGATDTGRPYFVMELVRGIKITDYCDQNNLSTRERLDLVHSSLPRHPARAPERHHSSGHQALEHPGHDERRRAVPKVIDFGIAKATQGKLTDQTLFTAFEQFIGTPAYMSPEQAEMSALDIDTRSDIYSWAFCSTNC